VDGTLFASASAVALAWAKFGAPNCRRGRLAIGHVSGRLYEEAHRALRARATAAGAPRSATCPAITAAISSTDERGTQSVAAKCGNSKTAVRTSSMILVV
jgi:hypothetical protein